MIHRQKCMIFYIRVTSHIGLAFVFIFSVLILINGDCGRNGYNDDNERRVMPYNPELSYRMAVLSVVAYDQSHPQHCLDQYLPAAKFQLQTVLTKKMWFRRKEVLWIYRGFVCFASDGRCLSQNWMHATTYWWIARVRHYPIARFSQWQGSGLFQDGLWRLMAVHGAESESSTFKESFVSDLGYRTFSWCCLSALGECLACLLQHRSTSKHHLIHFWEPSSWRLEIRSTTRPVSQQQLEGCKFWRHSSSSASLDPTNYKVRPLSPRRGGVLQCFTAKRPSVCILRTENATTVEHRETRTRPVVAANGLSLIYRNPLHDITTTLTLHLESSVRNLPAYK